MLDSAVRFSALALVLVVAAALLPPAAWAADSARPAASAAAAAPATETPAAEGDFFGNTPIADEELVHTPPPTPVWMSVGAPIALFMFFIRLC